MVGRLEYTIDVSAAQGVLQRATEEAGRELRKSLRDIGAFHTRRMQRGRFVPFVHGARPDKLQNRTGSLRRSFQWRVDGTQLGSLQLSLFTDSPYAPIQETGGTIRPKRKRFLRIPLRPALTAGGAPSGRAALRPTPNGFVTDLGPTFIFKGRSGGLFIGIKGQNIAGGRPKAFYVLKKQVTIEDRLGFVETFTDRTRRFIDARLGQVSARIERVRA